MSEEANKKLVRELFAAIDAHDKVAMFALLHEDYSMNLSGGGEPRDKEQHWLFASAMKAAFGDMVHRPDIQVAEGDLVFSQGTTYGHHTGVINGNEPTGRAFEAQFMNKIRVRDGKIVELMSLIDTVTLSKQLGFTDML
jgi:ketosteroid isomerase-like protein